MNVRRRSTVNQIAYRRLKSAIKAKYLKDRFVAIDKGKVVADAASFEKLELTLQRLGIDSPDVMVVQAGVDYPERAVIIL